MIKYQEPDLPKEYISYKELVLCSNLLSEVKTPILVNNMPVCLIGQGVYPQIWIAASTEPKGMIWDYVVEKNVVKNSLICVEYEGDSGIKIKLKDLLILSSKKESNDRVIVDILDMRPFGLNVYGDSKLLNIGTMKFSRNHFKNMSVAFKLGE